MSSITAFFEDRIVARGERGAVTRAIEEGYAPADHVRIRVYEDTTGRVVDLDYWDAAASAPLPPEKRGRGRPKLGVTPREVTLLPRHWDWLGAQPGGTSAALRRLVEAAAKAPATDAAALRARRDSAYRFMSDCCGDRPGYEEALRALYRGDDARLVELTAAWPGDVAAYLHALLSPPLEM
ncbi:MAG TPA: DUF2239 family protein [Allosphingosinicella sp.]|jgi:hypothetical protein